VIFQEIIVDTDICLKIGKVEHQNFLELLVPFLAEKIYIHRYVYEEIVWPQEVKDQIHRLISKGTLLMIDQHALDPIESILYRQSVAKLEAIMIHPKFPLRHRGEIHSLAMAKARSIPIFATDEQKLQPKVDRILNTGIGGFNIQCVGIPEILKNFATKDQIDLSRDDAKAIWLSSGRNELSFNQVIWPN
jgi:predicted nucleic acid-binding protein